MIFFWNRFYKGDQPFMCDKTTYRHVLRLHNFISCSQFLCKSDPAVTKLSMYISYLHISSLYKQIPFCIPTRKHLNFSNCFNSEVTEMRSKNTKAFRILSKIYFKDREKQTSFLEHCHEVIDRLGRQSFPSLSIKSWHYLTAEKKGLLIVCNSFKVSRK
jgi:hypothetical protein